ncbi:MAG: Calx-beta domain-containing protein [Cellulosilyticaceae bacterium]
MKKYLATKIAIVLAVVMVFMNLQPVKIYGLDITQQKVLNPVVDVMYSSAGEYYDNNPNFNGKEILPCGSLVDSGLDWMRSAMWFDLAGIQEDIQVAKLRIFVSEIYESSAINVDGVKHTDFLESWTTIEKEILSDVVISENSIILNQNTDIGTWQEIDVTNYVKTKHLTDSKVGFIIRGSETARDTWFAFDSKEAGPPFRAPELVLTTQVATENHGILQFSPVTATVQENGDKATLTVNRTDGSDGAVTVDYSVNGGTASGSGVDYTLNSGTLSFAEGEISKTIEINIVNDTDVESDETVIVSLSNPTGDAALGTDVTATLTIADDDKAVVYGKLQFNPKAVTVGEEKGSVDLTITRTDGSDGAVTVDYAVTGGTATGSGTDYALASGTISFANGESSKTIPVTITNDTKYEPSETIEVTLSNATGGATLGTDTVATITIADDDAAYGKLQFNPKAVTIGEEKGTVDLTITRTDGSDGPATVDYAVTGGTATGSGTDYTLVSGTISFANGESSKTIPVTITNDTKYEPSETIEVTLSNATGGATLGTDTVATITIADDDAAYGKLQFNPKTVTVGEEKGTVDLTVTRTDGSDGVATVDYAVTGGTATGSGTDYALASGTISFASGESSKTIPVSITNDTKYEPSETIEVTLSNATGGATLGTDTVAIITIADDDAVYGKLQFNPKAVTVGEEKGAVNLTITRTDGSDGAATVDYAVTGGTATGSGTDYTLASGTISFANGESSKTIPVSIANDTKYEPSETIEVTLSNATGGATLGTETVATITIVDNDAAYGKLQFNPKAVTIGEEKGTVDLTITRTDGSDGPVTVDYAVTGGTATGSGTDYALGSGTISFANGESSKTIPVSIANDKKYEADETIEVTLSNATGATLGTDTVATITIVDDDAVYGKLQFNPKAVTVGEEKGTIDLTITRTDGSDGPATVDYAVTGGTATGSGTDYTLVSGTISFANGESSKTIPVTITNDTKYEPSETIEVTLSNATGATLGTDTVATITMVDDDAAYGKLQFNPKAVTVGEADGTVNLTITRTDGSDGPATVDYAVIGGTATGSGIDYTLASGTISFANGESSKTIPVSIANDKKYEADETIEVTLSNATGATLGTDTVAIITIADDDAVYGKLQFNPKAVTVGEEKGAVDLTITRTDGSDGAATVDYAVTGGTATGSGTDYTLASGTISFANGESSKTIPVTITNDTKYEPSETIEVTLSNATGATLGTDTVATITIVDDDAVYGKLQFNPKAVTVGEEKGTIDLTITRTDGSDGPATVDYAVTGGTATGSGTDYTLVSGTISFANGESSKTIPVTITNDTKYEPSETIEVTLSNATGATLGTDTVATITMVDDDAAYGKLQFNPKAVTVGEADGTVNLTITRTDGSDGPATVDYAVIGGTATGSGIDYTLASGTISFANGESSKTIPVSIANDTKYELDKTIEVTLSNATGGATLGTDTVATITIVDDDAVYGKLQFNPNTVTVGEEKGSVDLTITRTDGSDGPVTVDYAVTGGTATGSGTDYTLASGTISFANGESSKTIPVSITNDTKYEPSETIEVTLSNATGGATLGTDTVATITIVDNDAAYGKLQFNPNTVTVGEEKGSVDLTITRTDGSDGAVTVDYAVTGGTTTGSGTDYTLASGTISFANGESSKTIPVTITNDTKYETDETIEVTLSNATGGAALGTDTVATITIVDNDAAYGKLQFNPNTVTVGEEKGSVDLTITRTDGSDGPVTVDYTVTGGTATGSGTDYTLASGTISFANGESSKTIPVSIANDKKYELDETIEVTLSNATGGATLGTDTVATITIVDDDAAYGKLQFNPKAVTVGEEKGSVDLTVTRTEGSDEAVTVDYTVTGGTATGNGEDYTLASGTLNFLDGETLKTIPVSIVDDTKYESNETIVVTLSSSNGELNRQAIRVATLGTNIEATITIIDNDKKPDSGGGGGGGSPSGNSETGKTNVPVIVDNKQENIGTQEVKGEKTTVVLDQDGLRDKLEKAGEGSQVTVPILNNTGSVSAQLVVQNVSDMAEKNILLEVKNGTVAYQIPTTAIDIKEIKAALGADANLSNASFNVTITQSEKSKIQEVALSAKDKEFSVVVPPVEFEITASYQDKEYTLTDFSNFVTREVEISGEDAKRITTAIVYEKDGTVRHIPTFVHEKDGKWYAKINSRTNSTYVLIYNYASFKDTEGKWYHNVVTEMASRKVISDLYSEVFEGDKAITRAEFATIIVRGLGLPDENELTFSDVDENRGYAGAIATAARYGIIKGIGDNKFVPDAGITREEAMAMMQRAAALTPFVQTSEQRNLAIEFSDFGEESSWASDAVSWNINNNLIVGANGKIRPKDSITRAETVAVILRLLQKSELVDKRN